MTNTDNAIKTAAGFFIIMLLGTLLSAAAGGLFGAIVAIVSPDFVTDLFGKSSQTAPTRYAIAVGMIWAVFIGAAVTGFACFLAAVIRILKIRLEYQKEKKPS